MCPSCAERARLFQAGIYVPSEVQSRSLESFSQECKYSKQELRDKLALIETKEIKTQKDYENIAVLKSALNTYRKCNKYNSLIDEI